MQKMIDDVDAEQKAKETLKTLFNKTLDFGPTLVEHCFLASGLSPDCKLADYGSRNYFFIHFILNFFFRLLLLSALLHSPSPQ